MTTYYENVVLLGANKTSPAGVPKPQDKGPIENLLGRTPMTTVDFVRMADFLSGFLRITSNRDKALKLIQYTLKLIIMRGKKSGPINGLKAAQNIASALSLARLIYRLGDWIHPITEELPGILQRNSIGLNLSFLESSMSFVNSVFDDLVTIDRCSKGEFPGFSEPVTTFLELSSTKLWLGTTLINLHMQLKRLTIEDIWKASKNTKIQDQLLTILKLSCDVVFCLYDINDIPRYKELPILAGMVAAFIGILKEVRKYRQKTA
jgi:hypothetical protein